MTSCKLSRRGLLQALGSGVLGGGLISRATPAKAAPALDLSTPPDPLWEADLPKGFQLVTAPLYSGGSILLAGRAGTDYITSFLWLDSQTRQFLPDPQKPFAVDGDNGHTAFQPTLYDGVLYIPFNHGGLFAVDANSRATLWRNTSFYLASAPVFSNGQLIFPTYEGQIVAVDLQGQQQWLYSTGYSLSPGAGCTTVHVEGVVACSFNDTIFAVDETGRFLWQYRAVDKVGSKLGAGNGQIFLVSGGQLIALDAITGKVNWSKPVNGTVSSAPVYFSDKVYTVTTAGVLMAFPSQDGNSPWTVPTRTMTLADFFIEDGVAYLGSGGTQICAVDLESEGQQIVTYTAKTAIVVVGVENGICYYVNLNQTRVGAVDIGHQIHQYFCESQLMGDDYAASGTTTVGYQPNSTWYRTQVHLQDQAGVPRANKAVKVSVSDNATLMANGQTYAVTPATPLWLTTNANGDLSVAIQASDVSCPALRLWGNFMADGEAIVIYPDHDVATALSQVDGRSLTSATTYDGTLMLPKNYSGAEDLAGSIRQTMGLPAVSLLAGSLPPRSGSRPVKRRAAGLLAVSPTTYIAYPDNTPNMTYESSAGTADRPYQPGSMPNWSLTINDNGAQFSSTAASLAASGSPITDIKTFVSKAVHGAERVANVVWAKVDKAAQAVIQTAENVYHIVVSAVEHAIAVVASILKSVIGDIKKAIQWLSYIFNWNDILQSKDMIKGTVNDWFTSLEKWAGDYAMQVQRTVNGAIDDAQLDVAGYTKTVVRALGGTTVESTQVAHNDPLALVGKGVEKWYSAMHWLMSKLTDNPSRHSVSNDAPSSYRQFASTYDGVFTDVAKQLAQRSAFQKLGPDLENLVTGLAKFTVDGPKRAVADIVQLVGDIALLALQATELAIDDILAAIPKLIAGARDFLNQPITIFGLSELWKAISKSPLTVLDLAALLIAVPGTIITKAKNTLTATLPGAYPSVLGNTWYWVAGATVNNWLVGLQDLMGTAAFPALRYTQLGVLAVLTAFTAPATGEEFKSPAEYSAWIISTTMFLLQLGGTIKSVVSKNADPEAASRQLWITCLGGVIQFSFAIAIFGGSNVSDPVVIKRFLVSAFGAVPLIMKPLRSGQSFTEQTVALAAIDDLFGETQIGLKISLWT